MKYNLVIARFNENIDWLYALEISNYDIFLYNKGEDDLLTSNIKLPNIGREAETFIRYIVDNYYSLPEYCVFIQGDPFAHCQDFYEKIKNHTNEPFVFLTKNVIAESITGWYEIMIERPIEYPVTYLINAAEDILVENIPDKVAFVPGSQYILSKEIILRRDIKFYELILKKFLHDYLLPWHLERLWLNIFKINYKVENGECMII